jgi:hypothetical protein
MASVRHLSREKSTDARRTRRGPHLLSASKPDIINPSSTDDNDERTKMSTKTLATKGTKVEVSTTTVITATQEAAVLNPVLEATIIEFNHAKKMVKEFEDRKKAAEAILLTALDGAKAGLINGVERVTISDRSNTSFDRAKLLSAFPEAYAATLKETSYIVLLAK